MYVHCLKRLAKKLFDSLRVISLNNYSIGRILNPNFPLGQVEHSLQVISQCSCISLNFSYFGPYTTCVIVVSIHRQIPAFGTFNKIPHF